jgi:mono/diheme cytochrome c family protein
MNLPSAVRAFRARPVAALAAIFVVTMMGNALLVGCGGKKQEAPGETPVAETPPAEGTTPSGASGEVSLAAGQKVYTERCVLCHGTSGKGDGQGAAGLDPKPRDHTNGEYMNARTDDQLLEVIRNGKGNMPAWGSILSDAEQRSVLMYVRSLAVPPYPGASH